MADVLLYLTNIMQRFSFGQPNLNLNRKDKGSKFPRFRVCLIGAFGSPINPSSYRRASLSTDVSLVLYLLFVLFIMLNREDGWYLLELWYR